MNIDSKSQFHPTATIGYRFTISVLLCAIAFSGELTAQDNYARPEAPKKSAIEKLSELNQKLKRNLKESLFGSGSNATPEQNERVANAPYERPSQQQARSLPSQYQTPRQTGDVRGPQQDSRSQLQNPNRHATQANYQQELDRAGQQYNGYPEQMAPPHYGDIPENRFRQTEQQMATSDRRDQFLDSQQYQPNQAQPQQHTGSSTRPPQGEYYGARSGMPNHSMQMQQQPVRQQPVQQSYAQPHLQQNAPAPQYRQQHQAQQAQPNRAAQPNGGYRSGHYSNGAAQQQFNQQETATQRALRLRAENQALADIRQSITAENKRLKDQLKEKNKLLKEIESAIMAARTELQNANQKNATLARQIVKLESEKAQQIRSSTRQLNAIRKKLDDVLMLEITSK